MDALAAEMVTDRNTAAVTVSVKAFEVIPLCEAVMSLEPAAIPVATPLPLMAAAEAFDEFHTTEFVRFWVLPSLKLPVAVN
jgi:hypothetical protein